MQYLITFGAFLCLSLTVGCTGTTYRTGSTTQDGLLEQMANIPISGFWRDDAEGFGGEFNDLVFTPLRSEDRAWQTEGGKLVCTVSGTGLIWEESDNRHFAITGRSVGRTLELEFKFERETIKATGLVKGNDIWSSSCAVEFVYEGKPRRVTLNCVGDINAERQDFKQTQ